MNLSSALESLLFISSKPLSLKELASATEHKVEEVEAVLDQLAADYLEQQRGFILVGNNKQYQLTTAPENADLISKFLKDETSGELTQPSLEALTIIAYRGPVTKAELEMIRGVNCSLILRNLLIRGLIEENLDKVLGESVYSVTLDFLKYLGMTKLSDLPDYENLHARTPLVSPTEDDNGDVVTNNDSK